MSLNSGELLKHGSLKADAARDAKVHGLPKLKRCNWQAVTRIRKQRVPLKRRKILVLPVAFAGWRGANQKASATSRCGIKTRRHRFNAASFAIANGTVTSPQMQSQIKGKINTMKRKANSKLIAAAPELLSELEKIVVEADFSSDDGAKDLGERLLEIDEIARAAIAKASTIAKIESEHAALAAVEVASARLLVGLSGKSTADCEWYDGIDHDAQVELNLSLANLAAVREGKAVQS